MDLGLLGKVALIGGSSRGLGRAIAEELAREGVDLMLCSRTAAAVEQTAEEIGDASSVRVIAVAADLSDPADVQRVTNTAFAAWGRVDILVTNTGGPPAGSFESHTPDAWRAAIANNLESVVNLVRGVLPGMKQQRWGRIVNVTSIAVKQPVDDLILSNSIRAAVTGFARTLANEVAPHGITVNNVMPGYTRTDRLEHLASRVAGARGIPPSAMLHVWDAEIPMGRIGEPAELSAVVAFLVSERASYLTGQSIAVDGGWIRSLL
ncbi:MAG: SDR family oxidoreductase [Gemmatimonadetes bacterium]|nr:SDR family oxidoreductase [Gemmatimonadota bacterium]